MRTLVPLLVLCLVGTSAALDTPPGPPTEFALYPNDPNPFCPNPGTTTIRFTIPMACEADLRVRDSGSNVVRTLLVGALQAGFYTVIWDGRDDGAAVLPDGMYPYELIARVGGQVVFTGTQTAELACVVGVETSTWGQIKALYGDGRNAVRAERSN